MNNVLCECRSVDVMEMPSVESASGSLLIAWQHMRSILYSVLDVKDVSRRERPFEILDDT